MTAAKDTKIEVTLDEFNRMLSRLLEKQDKNKAEYIKRMDSMEHRLGARIDKLQHTVIGNGDERAIIVRLYDLERKMDDLCDEYKADSEKLDKLESFVSQWRNRVIGIFLAFPIITALLVYVLGHILGITLAP